jgi:predicted RecB family nuclease
MDAFGEATERDETSPFVELLLEQGLVHENAIADGLSITAIMKLIDLADRERETLRAMARCEPLIYGGRLTAADLVGEPDLLEWTGMGYIPGDIKSGSGFDGDESEGKFKKHYAFQLAHYVFILEQLGFAASDRSAYIVDRDSRRVAYLKERVEFPIDQKEVFFDIEADPMRGVVYLHGFVERESAHPETAIFTPYYAEGIERSHEEAAFRGAWNYRIARVQDSTIYYYSKYERTEYKHLAAKYPAVCSVADVGALFASPVMIDLYFDVIKRATEWPLYNQSIKAK